MLGRTGSLLARPSIMIAYELTTYNLGPCCSLNQRPCSFDRPTSNYLHNIVRASYTPPYIYLLHPIHGQASVSISIGIFNY